MAEYQGVLFDLDGTLLDTAPDLGRAANVALTKFGYPQISEETAGQVSSHGTAGLLRAALGTHYDRTDIAPMRHTLLESYRDNINIDTRSYDGVAELIGFLDSSSIPWGIVTNKPHWLTVPLLEAFPLFGNRLATVSGDTCGVAKPDPKPMLLGAKQIGVAPSNILYVGDAQRDIDAGRNAQMSTATALWGYLRPTDQPREWGGDFHCRDPFDLLDRLRS